MFSDDALFSNWNYTYHHGNRLVPGVRNDDAMCASRRVANENVIGDAFYACYCCSHR